MMDFSLTDAQRSIKNGIMEFARKELNCNLAEDDDNARFPLEKWHKCAKMGLMGLCIEEKYGGQGFDLLTAVIAVEALGYACKDSGLVHSIITHNLCGIQISQFGNDFQKERYLSTASAGEIICAQAITEPDAGSDVSAIRTKAEKCSHGYIINGNKTFITNGPIADVVLLMAVTDARRKALGGMSWFVVEKDNRGLKRCAPFNKMGLRTLQNGELVFSECTVSSNDLLGREGHGMSIFNQGIQLERTMLFASHLGVLRRCLEGSIKYSKERYQSGQPIGRFQLIAEKISRMKMNYELGQLMLFKAAWLIDNKQRANLESSIAKLFISESLKDACLDTMQIHGAYGYTKEFEIERDLRDSIASTIYSGTSEIQKIIISTLTGL